MVTHRIGLALVLTALVAGCSDQLPVAPSRATAPAVSLDRGSGEEHGRGKKKGHAHATSTLLTNMPVTGTLPGGGTFSGLLTVTSFAMQNGQLVASGLLTGSATQGGVTQAITQPFASVPATLDPPPGCSILTLSLGALHLDLLGLVVDLAPVNLDVTAQTGAGNLLGNLLCAVTNLLNGPGALAGVTNLLNQVNAILAGL